MATPAHRTAPPRLITTPGELAVIDVGSNTARLVLFDTTASGGLRSVFESKEVPRLIQGVRRDGSLTADAIDRGVAAMRRFARQLEASGRPTTVAVATSAVRDAPNGEKFLSRVRSETGLEIRTLSGSEEARYAYLGVAAAWQLDNDLVVDLGGGSLQAASTRDGQLSRVVSLPLGALRVTQRFLLHDPPKARELDALREHVRDEFAGLPALHRETRLFGIGGTIRCLARVLIEIEEYPLSLVHGYTIRARQLPELEEVLAGIPNRRRREIAGISSHRADVIVAGIITVEELLRATGQKSLIVSGTGIREGIALETIGASLPASTETLTYRSVTAAARAFGFSLSHGEEVRRVATQLFDLLARRRGFRGEDRAALQVAAWMHDVGSVVEIWRHPRHSSYILRHAAILGLSHREILLGALAAYLHEGDPMPEAWRDAWRPILKAEDLERVRELGTILYFAETLDGAQVSLRIARGSNRLHVRPVGGPGAEASERAMDRLVKSLRRTFDLEVVTDPA